MKNVHWCSNAEVKTPRSRARTVGGLSIDPSGSIDKERRYHPQGKPGPSQDNFTTATRQMLPSGGGSLLTSVPDDSRLLVMLFSLAAHQESAYLQRAGQPP